MNREEIKEMLMVSDKEALVDYLIDLEWQLMKSEKVVDILRGLRKNDNV